MKKVLVLVFSNLRHDARVKRQVTWLKKKYSVTVACFDSDDISGVKIVRIEQTKLSLARKALLGASLALKNYRIAYRLFHNYKYLENELDNSYDLIIANDIDTLPLAFQLNPAAKIVLDAHEYAPRHFENSRTWKVFFQPFYIYLCKKYIPRVSAMLTVGEGLGREYARNFSVKPTVISNATNYHETMPSDVEGDSIRLIHHGIANPSRKLELMVEMMRHLDNRFTLDMILMTSDYAAAKTKAYIQRFKEQAEQDPRIRFLPSVASDQVVSTINRYDIGVFLIPPVNFNYANTLPNKLFEYIQARLGVAIGPTPEMAAIVNRYQNGVISDDFDPVNLAQKLNSLTKEDIIRFKDQSAVAARDLNAEKNGVVFDQLIESVLR